MSIAVNKNCCLVNLFYDRILSCLSKLCYYVNLSMPSNLSTPKPKIKKNKSLPFTCQLPGLAKATEWLCVTDPRKRFLGKTDMVVYFLLRDSPKPEREASLTPVKAVSRFNFPITWRMNWEMKNLLSLDF